MLIQQSFIREWCLLEGTGLSEGRGTTRPFEIFGAPFIDPDMLVKLLAGFKLPGVIFRPMYFEPTFQKHADTLCGGAQIHVTNRKKFEGYPLSMIGSFPVPTNVTGLYQASKEIYSRGFRLGGILNFNIII